MTGDITPSRLHPADAVRTSTVGLRTRRTRSLLSALGILIGIAAMIAVLGLSESSKSDLLAQLDRLGTNLLRVQATEGIGLGTANLPETALAMTGRLDGVERVSAQVDVAANVFRSDYIPTTRTGGLTVKAVDAGILGTLKGTVAEGRFLDGPTDRYPLAVLGSVAAERLGIRDLSEPPRVWIGNQWFSVIGILHTLDLNPDLDRSAIIGVPAAQAYLGSDGVASTIFVRTAPAQSTPSWDCSRQPSIRSTPTRSGPRARRRPSRPARQPRARSPSCCSAWAPSLCSSGPSGSPTSWSSRCSNGAQKSGCAAPSGRPSGTSPSSS